MPLSAAECHTACLPDRLSDGRPDGLPDRLPDGLPDTKIAALMAPPISPLMAPLIGPLMAPSSGLHASLRALRLELWTNTILTGREGSLQYLGVQRAVRGRGATKYRTGARALAVEPVALRMVLGRLGDVVHPVCSTTGLGFVKSVRNHRRIHNLRVPQPTPRAPWRSELQSRFQ